MHNYISQKLTDNGFECYIVGGAVRDYILDVPCHDVDLATNAKPDQIIALFPNDKVNLVGETFKVVIVNDVEVATYRKDVYFGDSHKNCEISYADTIEEDLARRDLTINAMAMCTKTGEIIDPFDGQIDIERNAIRFVGNPEDRINEDPNRILRALRFITKYGFPLSKETYETINVIRKNNDKFDLIAKERVYGELCKVLEMSSTSIFFEFANFCDILEKMFPSLAGCVDHTGGKYHDETVFDHCMIVGDNLNTGCKLLKLAGYLHDVGKSIVYDAEADNFLDHENAGADVVYQELLDLRFPIKDVEYIANLIRTHMRSTCETSKAARKLIADLKVVGVNYRDHIRMKIADRKGNLKKTPLSFQEIKVIITRYEQVMVDFRSANSQKELKINGCDVMNALDIKPGPVVGQLLRAAFDAVLNEEIENQKYVLINYVIKTYHQ